MNYEQRNAVVAIVTNLTVSAYIIWQTWEIFAVRDAQADGILAEWAQLVLWAIPLSVLSTIIVSIVFNIIWAIVTNTPKPSFVVDERDKQIGELAMRVTTIVAGTGFILATIALAFGWAALPAFVMIYFGFAFGDLAGNITRIGFYRWGA